MKTVWRVFAYLKRYPVLGISMLACAITGTLMIMVPPVVTKQVIDEVVPGHHRETFASAGFWWLQSRSSCSTV